MLLGLNQNQGLFACSREYLKAAIYILAKFPTILRLQLQTFKILTCKSHGSLFTVNSRQHNTSCLNFAVNFHQHNTACPNRSSFSTFCILKHIISTKTHQARGFTEKGFLYFIFYTRIGTLLLPASNLLFSSLYCTSTLTL